jgi:predicted acyl esterase
MHGLGGNRAEMLALAQSMGIAGERYAVLAFDARGHGQSGGLIGIDGPREVADVKAVFAWLRDRPDVADRRIGGWGISYGGGAAWNSLTAGVPWAALEIAESWTDLRQALVPQGLAKTGVIAGFLGSLDPKRVDPEVFALRDAAFAGNLATVVPFAAARSSLPSLKGVTTPVLMMQGRRDFAFGLEHALNAYRALAGPKELWIGLHGHAPSSFPAADTPATLAEGAHWFDRFLRGDTSAPLAKSVAVSPESWNGQPRRFAGLPKVVVRRSSTFGILTIPAGRAIPQSGRYRIPLAPRPRATEVFGSPTVDVTATASGGWSRIVAVLSARTPSGRDIVVAGGGVPARPGKRTYRIALSSQATFLPKGSRLTLTLGSSSLAQSPANLLYLDLPFASTARLRVASGTVRIPELATPVSR